MIELTTQQQRNKRKNDRAKHLKMFKTVDKSSPKRTRDTNPKHMTMKQKEIVKVERQQGRNISPVPKVRIPPKIKANKYSK